MDNIEQSLEHICQNCGADLQGNFCSNCGQKSDAIFNKTIFSIIGHFFEELFTWDSRFFQSIKFLFTKPGYLTHEYISGRIQRYVSPLKMFLFTSFVLFFVMLKSDPNQYRSLVTNSGSDNFLRQFILEQQSNSSISEELYIEEFNSQFNNNITLYIFAVMIIFSILLKIAFLPKNYFYAEHIVFTLHFFTFVLWSFLLGVIFHGLGELFVFFFWYFLPGVYLFLAIKNVYHKTIWVALLVSVFMTFAYWILITMWIFGTIVISAVRAV